MTNLEEESVDRNVYYSRRGWEAPDIPVGFQITRQDLVILMTVCSQVRFLSTGQNKDYSHIRPTGVCSAITQDILDIENVMLGGHDHVRGSMASVPKVVVKKKGASPIGGEIVHAQEELGRIEAVRPKIESLSNDTPTQTFDKDQETIETKDEDEDETDGGGMCTWQ